ncbi:delta(3,5)-Delta(2,4)-dienoyl-CoA isomerase, peroxisomal-like [Arachis stenosperma]|uniref:delta(3,5)-Delta(2,4)-dienoyl-CoA isomerase, peroxisomal-like n=1 Tax=Arachis stenosperma TaxID=217475 RepID=UPI0025ABB60A|nr:delta(3,5)-Delta(2,4)-dienoyl-CoA isomerase, peroxisomal-like [Arachis stenosperma]
MADEKYKTLEVVEKNPKSGVFHLYLNRPRQRNALTHDFFTEFPKALYALDHNRDVNVIVLSGAGDHFCSGIDISQLKSISQSYHDAGESLRRQILAMQDSVTALERCRKPVIASIHGACIGGAIDIVTACDLRYCTEDAFFSVKEVDLALAADLGTLQRLPLIVGYGNAMELALTARRFSGSEAKQLGLVSRAFPSKVDLDQAVSVLAQEIAAKSPLAIMGTKTVLLKSRDLTVDQGLDFVATMNSARLLSSDLTEAVAAQLQKRKPVFSKL